MFFFASMFASIVRCIINGKWLPKMVRQMLRERPFRNFFPDIDSSTLRAYPPTRLHAPYLHAPRYSCTAPCKRHANAHTLGPRAWDPGPKKRARVPGTQGGQGALRAPWARAHGARWGYSEAIPNGCYSAGRFCGGAFSK